MDYALEFILIDFGIVLTAFVLILINKDQQYNT